VRWAAAIALTEERRVREVVATVACHLTQAGKLSDQSLDRILSEMGILGARLKCQGIDDLRDVSQGDVEAFIDESVPGRTGDGWRDPSLNSRHFRRTVARLLFQTARSLGLCEHDPTMDIVLPARTRGRCRPLTDDEVLNGEAASLHTLVATRLPAAWALAEAGAITSEIAVARVEHLDLDEGRVWLEGCTRRTPRWGQLTEWGVRALHRRLQDIGSDPATPLVYNGRSPGKSAQSASCGAVHEVLVLAGLANEPDIRPLSVAGWAGVKVFERTGRVEDVATALGLRSLDRAAATIGWEWQP
jgi:integrase/recombinase XerC